jgi:hypothetical protein
LLVAAPFLTGVERCATVALAATGKHFVACFEVLPARPVISPNCLNIALLRGPSLCL